MKARVAIAVVRGYEQQAERLAERLDLETTTPDDPAADFLLQFVEDRLELQQTGPKAPGPVFVDFVAGKAAYRRKQGEGRRTPLARALGFKADFTPGIVDGTAGLGQDALVLATLGGHVTLVEQSPVVHALLEDGFRRAMAAPETRDIVARMTLVHADAVDYLAGCAGAMRPDAVYLDPMYPHRGKKALSKKGMQSLQKLLGADRDGPLLLRTAKAVTRKRVAVKRPLKAPCLDDQAADFQIVSSKVRFDVYLSDYTEDIS
ncbi:class I SAM-dependent methyltransferase [Thiolapillus sp.]